MAVVVVDDGKNWEGGYEKFLRHNYSAKSNRSKTVTKESDTGSETMKKKNIKRGRRLTLKATRNLLKLRRIDALFSLFYDDFAFLICFR
ncbi:hypothetical protein GBA52_026295 [Prunus armeniaca]|nr:hypothetical protein GBA52_026295 [Prunus armeniaca]